MKHVNGKLIAILLLGLCLQVTQAQTALFVKEKSGTNTPFNLSTLKSLTFTGTTVVVNKKDASTSTFLRTDVRYMNFVENATNDIVPIGDSQNDKLMVYPNPVKDVLNIQLANAHTTVIEIVDMMGKVVLRSVINSTHNIISVSSLPKGIYLLRSNEGGIKLSTKLIKQ